MHNHSASLLATALLVLAIFSTSWPHSALADDGVLETAPQSATEADIEENVLDASALNDADDATIAPQDKGGPATRQAPGCKIVVDNWTPWKIQIFVNGVHRGMVSSWGDASGRFQGRQHVLYGLARFTDGSTKSWGPSSVTCASKYTWMLTP
jgi:hypothetical protein